MFKFGWGEGGSSIIRSFDGEGLILLATKFGGANGNFLRKVNLSAKGCDVKRAWPFQFCFQIDLSEKANIIIFRPNPC